MLSGEYCGEWKGATLKKLPIWGEKVSDDKVNFEWPTQEAFDKMSPVVSLQSIEFKTYCYGCSSVSSVRVSLSNGEASPVFERSGSNLYKPKTIKFDPNTPIKAVEAYDGGDYAGLIRFMDSEGKKVYEYNPSDISQTNTS